MPMFEAKKPSARELALAVLSRVRKGARPSEALDILDNKFSLDRKDFALASRIVLDVVQNMYLLDFYIAAFSTVKPEKMDAQVLDVLRAGAAQLLFLDRVPARAAVNESVKLVKKLGKSSASGLVNAVLRRIAETLPGMLPTIPGEGSAEYLSIKYSHPLWLTQEFAGKLGYAGARELLSLNNEIAPVTVQVNTLKTTAEKLLELWAEGGVEAERHAFVPNCFELKSAGAPALLPGFEEGLFYIQDAAARLAVTAAGVEAGMNVFDCCAAPGGKSFAAAITMKNEGRILSCDISEKKLAKISDGAERLGIGIMETRKMDARVPDVELFGAFDVVIADVPCSGFGVIRRKPEIRYKTESEISGLSKVQADIINNISKCVRPEGVLIYSTCTMRESENIAVIREFLQSNAEFKLEDIELSELISDAQKGDITLYPHIHGTDGFFICKMRRGKT